MAIVTIYFEAKQRLGSNQRELLVLLKQKPMLIQDMFNRHTRSIFSLYLNGLIARWENEFGQRGYQITDKGRKALEG